MCCSFLWYLPIVRGRYPMSPMQKDSRWQSIVACLCNTDILFFHPLLLQNHMTWTMFKKKLSAQKPCKNLIISLDNVKTEYRTLYDSMEFYILEFGILETARHWKPPCPRGLLLHDRKMIKYRVKLGKPDRWARAIPLSAFGCMLHLQWSIIAIMWVAVLLIILSRKYFAFLTYSTNPRGSWERQER